MGEPLFGCQFGAINPELILRSLISVVNLPQTDLLRALRLRPIDVGREGVTIKAITCASKEDFEINLRRALHITCDGRISLNVASQGVECDEDTGDPLPCNHTAGMYELWNHLFVEVTHLDETKEYALAVLLIFDEGGLNPE